jgi:chorismate synthase
MSGNSFGKLFTLTSFGESHGTAIGGVIDGCPAGLDIDLDFVQTELARRKPGQSALNSPRQEDDQVEFLSGLFEGKTTGTPIGFLIRNKDARSQDYAEIKSTYRPSHADYTYDQKYGFRDYRGGGRSSARETACRVVAGAIAKLFLAQHSITVQAFVKQVGKTSTFHNYDSLDLSSIDTNLVRCPDPIAAQQMIADIESARDAGDSLGGIIQAVALNVPAGLGEPVFDKLHAALGHAILSINAVKGFEIGSGFEGATALGSEQNDQFIKTNDHTIKTTTNNSGGIQGGISNGMPIWFNVAFKPVATIKKEQHTVTQDGDAAVMSAKGRHDPCVLPRAVPIVESMTALVLADFILQARSNRI